MTKTQRKTANTLPRNSGSRDAVESSIDISKEDKHTTWEQAANRKLTKITRWEDTKKRPSAASA